MSTQAVVRIPLRSVTPQFDTDDPNYLPGDPGTYLLLALCYDSLAGPSTRQDDGGIVSPNFLAMKGRLAEAFGQNDDSTWWVRLRKGVLSHWGNELTAESIHWGLRKAFALDNIGAWRWGQVAGLQSASDVRVVDKYTLSYTFRAPNPHFPAYLFFATPNIYDAAEVTKHANQDDPWGMAWLSQNVAGFGPFQLVDLEPDRMVLRARKDYWAEEPPIPQIAIEKAGSRDDALRLLDERDPVFLAGLRCDEVQELKSKENVRLFGTWAGHASVELDHSSPPFDDIRVRHALNFATPYREIMTKGFLGQARPWKSPIKTYSAWYTDRFWDYETNLAKARALLAEAGLAGGFETQLYAAQRPDALRVAEILQRAYGQIGIEVELAALESAPVGWMPPMHVKPDCGHNLSEPLYDLAHDHAPFNPILPAPGGPIGVGTWRPRYVRNPELEDMYRDTLLANDEQTRRERCIALQKAIVEFAPRVFLAETQLFNATNSETHAWLSDFDNRLAQVTLFQNSSSRYLSE